MSPEFIKAAREEESALERKLVAVRAMLEAYGETPSCELPQMPLPLTSAPRERKAATPKLVPRAWTERPKDQFTAYGQTVVQAAVDVVRSAEDTPIKTRDIVERMQADGVAIRGNDPINALGALLARSSFLVSHGKRGWAMAEPYVATAPNENEASAADATDASETAQDAQAEGDHRDVYAFPRVAGPATP